MSLTSQLSLDYTADDAQGFRGSIRSALVENGSRTVRRMRAGWPEDAPPLSNAASSCSLALDAALSLDDGRPLRSSASFDTGSGQELQEREDDRRRRQRRRQQQAAIRADEESRASMGSSLARTADLHSKASLLSLAQERSLGEYGLLSKVPATPTPLKKQRRVPTPGARAAAASTPPPAQLPRPVFPTAFHAEPFPDVRLVPMNAAAASRPDATLQKMIHWHQVSEDRHIRRQITRFSLYSQALTKQQSARGRLPTLGTAFTVA